MKNINRISTILIIALSIGVIIVSYLAFNVGVMFNVNSLEVTWDAFNTSIALLELYIVVFTIGIGIAGFYGWKAIKDFAKDYIEKCFAEVKKENDKKLGEALERNTSSVSSAVQNIRELEHIRDVIQNAENAGGAE